MFRKTKIETNSNTIEKLLTRGVEDVLIRDSLKKKLLSGKPLRIKLGIDPTSPNLHLGRAIPLRKLRDFQNLGHTAVFIVGDFTALVGDASDKLAKRPMLSEKEVADNIKTYKKQVGKIIDLRKAEFHYNSTWLSKLRFTEITKLAETFSVQQMIERRNFKDRLEGGIEISLREFLYPLMQGYDSVAVKADVELGGFDQLFNLKAGRTIQKYYSQPEQDILVTAMLDGTDGRKMSSSWGNVISLLDTARDMYGKVMSVKDELVEKYFMLCTDLSEKDIQTISEQTKNGSNPKEAKMRLAKEITALYHGSAQAIEAEQFFVDTFSKGKIPDDVHLIKTQTGQSLADILVKEKIISSKSDWRRLVDEGAITLLETNEKIKDSFYTVKTNTTIRIGKKRFVKIEI